LNGNFTPILKGTVQGIPARIRILTKVSLQLGILSFRKREFFILTLPFCVHETVVPVQKRKDAGRGLRGLGEHMDVDPTMIRLVWAVVTVLSVGMGILVYLIAWIIIPESPRESTEQTATTDG
jgi:phage shock protein PspC (stress-responsive transcriptional regulator)